MDKVVSDAIISKVFAECVEKQRTQPQYDWHIAIDDNEYFREGEHWFFFQRDWFTNIPMLGIGFVFTTEQEKLFQSLSFASEFEKDEKYDGAYSIECGADVDKAALLTSTILYDVFHCDKEIPFKLVNFNNRNPKGFVEHTHNISFKFVDLPFDEKIYAKIRKKVDYFNRKAEKNSYTDSHIIFDEKARAISGSFKAVDEKSGKNYFAEVLIAGRNADLSAEIVNVITLCYKLFEN
ncbi:MAG: hypothetical protein K2H63_06310 [Paramuribaculum sp.]|nr:hypothetical protein [Paramuribaculum sp.]